MLVGLLICCTFVGCGGNGGDDGKGAAIASYVTVGSTKVALDGSYDQAMISVLGTPSNTEQAPSCHHEGFDATYYYEGYTIYTYVYEDKQVIYSVEITDAAIKTAEGAAVGNSLAELEAIYGTDYAELANGVSYTLSDKAVLNFRMKDGIVSRIEYYTE